MPLTSGTRIGSYEIIGPLGAGGMGEVYRAKDTRLNRIVALKAMHESFAQDPERAARFEREAQLLASLNHPNIAAIHGVQEAQGATFLVLEFVDGRPLSEMLQAGPLPLAEATAIATQIAGALAAAHERGIIHRDLKPGNVMVTPDGHVKVLDFGLGKALEGDASHASEPGRPAAQSPTMTMAATQAGIILGTAGYMSPEQAKGRAADKRSDVWAFGCVLFELLTGKRAFDGEDVTEVLAAIVRGEPEWQALPADVPAPMRELVRRCLVKNKTERLADMSVVLFVLNERASGVSGPGGVSADPASGSADPSAQSSRSSKSISLPIAAGLMAIAALITAGAMAFWPRATASGTGGGAAATRAAHLSIALPDGDELAWLREMPLAISPDGTQVVYAALHDGKSFLFLRQMTDPAPKLLPGTEGGKSPFFSPNGQWIAFFAQRKLKKITVGGTALGDLADAIDARGGAWSGDDVIYFAPTNVSNIWKVPAGGGAATEVTHLDRAKGEISHRWPHVLPGDRAILYTAWTGPGPDEHQILELSVDSSEPRVLIKGGDTPRYLPSGHLTYGRLDGLYAVPWRPGQGDLNNAVPVTLTETPMLDGEGASDYVVSSNGTMAYVAGGAARLATRLVWVDRAGKTEALPLPEREYESVAISPDGRQAAVQIQDSVVGIWLYDFARQTMTPFLKGVTSSQAPLWSADGKSIIYRGTRTGFRNLYIKAADGTGVEERLTTQENAVHTPTSVSPDGEWVIYNEGGAGAKNGPGIWRVRLRGNHTPELLLQNGESNAQVSPDGKWLAFQTSNTQTAEISVQPFPGPGPREQVSIGGGTSPLWSRDGKELYYETIDTLMAVDVRTSPGFSAGTPRVIAQGRYRVSANSNTQYSVSPDGRFLRVQRVQPERPVTRIDVVLNWFERLTPQGQK
jgi:eukaryotic-like serine/threonine-protein kinase